MSIDKYILHQEQIQYLEEDLDELINNSKKFVDDVDDNLISNLLSLHNKEASTLANDILDIEDEIKNLKEEYDNYIDDEQYDDPFINLYDEDTEM